MQSVKGSVICVESFCDFLSFFQIDLVVWNIHVYHGFVGFEKFCHMRRNWGGPIPYRVPRDIQNFQILVVDERFKNLDSSIRLDLIPMNVKFLKIILQINHIYDVFTRLIKKITLLVKKFLEMSRTLRSVLWRIPFKRIVMLVSPRPLLDTFRSSILNEKNT